MMWKYIFIEFCEKLLVCSIRNSNSSISINHIFGNLMELEGISTKDLHTKTYFMS